MLIKPFIKKVKPCKLSGINSLPSNTNNHPAYFGTQDENKESLEIEGRLLMLPVMTSEWNVKENKKLHNSNCGINWAICDCRFARHIRAMDLGLDKYKFEEII